MPLYRRLGGTWKLLTGGGGTIPDGGSDNWDPATAGSLPLGQTYPIPASGVYYVDNVTGSDADDGLTPGTAYATLRKTLNVPAGSTIVIRGDTGLTPRSYHEGGTHNASGDQGLLNYGQQVTIQNYPGEKVEFDGSKVVTAWTADAGFWSTPWTNPQDRSPTNSRGSDDSTVPNFGWINASYPLASWSEQLWVDDGRFVQVATKAELGPGKFWVEGTYAGGTATPSQAGANKYLFTPTKYFIGSNPAGHTVRIGEYASALNLVGGGSILRGIKFRRYVNSLPDFAPVKLSRENSVIENCVIDEMANMGLQVSLRADMLASRVTVTNCGHSGIQSNNADRVTFEYVRCEGNNWQNFNFSPACAGTKITRCLGATVRYSVFSNNQCQGLWFDESVYDVKAVSIDCISNAGHGFIFEICAKLQAIDLRVCNNGKIGIYISSSNDSYIWNSTAVGNAETDIDIAQDARRPGTDTGRDPRQAYPASLSYMTWVITNVTIGNCALGHHLAATKALLRIRSTENPTKASSTFGAVIDGDLYNRVSGTLPSWQAANAAATISSFTTLSSWQGRGYDAHATFVDGSDAFLANFMLTSAAQSASASTARPLPAAPAALAGRATGIAHIGAWR